MAPAPEYHRAQASHLSVALLVSIPSKAARLRVIAILAFDEELRMELHPAVPIRSQN
jgi:hypothetical protein